MASANTTTISFKHYRITRLDQCVVFVSMTGPLPITEDDAHTILHHSSEVTQHRHYVVLVDVSLVNKISSEARHVFASAPSILAAAMIGSTPMDRVLAAPYKLTPTPSEYFTDKDEALRWLGLMHGQLCRNPVDHTMSPTN